MFNQYQCYWSLSISVLLILWVTSLQYNSHRERSFAALKSLKFLWTYRCKNYSWQEVAQLAYYSLGLGVNLDWSWNNSRLVVTAGLEPDFGVSSQVSSLLAHATSVTGLGLRLTFSYIILLISRDNALPFVLFYSYFGNICLVHVWSIWPEMGISN